MIIYLDTSAIVKRYLAEANSAEVAALINQADRTGTSLISRAEVAAAFAKAVRMKVLDREAASKILTAFRGQWLTYSRLHVTEALVARADALAWDHGLRGYDAVHLASAISWQEHIGESITLATFDQQLWEAGQAVGLSVWPPK